MPATTPPPDAFVAVHLGFFKGRTAVKARDEQP
jgi:hypothetical protein